MIKLILQYYEIIDQDYTAVDAFVVRNQQAIAHFRNYDPKTVNKGIFGNQTEFFALPNIAVARTFLLSAGTYKEVPLDLKHKSCRTSQ